MRVVSNSKRLIINKVNLKSSKREIWKQSQLK
jgi:hypothetical protein